MEDDVGKTEGQVNPVFQDDEPQKRSADDIPAKAVAKECEGDPERQQWANPTEFLLSCVAMSVGLGNVWRFPFVAYENGGGAFLIPYIVVLLFIGKPLYYMELCMGQFASSGSVKVWDLAPAFRGIGYGQMVATWAVVTYYVSLMALTVYYFFASFTSVLPWAECHEEWSSPYCVGASQNISEVAFDKNLIVTSSEDFFQNEVLKMSPDGLDSGIGAPKWDLSLCLLLSWIILFLILVKGVRSSGKASYFTALFPYLVLFILLARGVTLPGSLNGIKRFITPDWPRLLDLSVWYAAISQSFFSLSVGFGSIIMFASYNGFRHNVYRDATILSVTDTFTSILAGFTIFSILGHLEYHLELPFDQLVGSGGTTLAFVCYPDVLARFQWAPQLFSVLFFLMLFTLGVGSASALTGCVITIVCDEFPGFRKWAVTLVICVLGFALGLFYVTPQGQHILTLVDYYGGGFVIFILAVLEVIAVHWIYGINNFCNDIEFMLKRRTGIYWKFCWAVFIPTVLLVVFAYSLLSSSTLRVGSYEFGTGAHAFGIFLTLLAIGMVPTFFGVSFFSEKTGGDTFLKIIKELFKPNGRWGPKNPHAKQEYLKFLSEKENESTGVKDFIMIWYNRLKNFLSRKDSHSEIAMNGV